MNGWSRLWHHERLREIAKFSLVGGANYVVDLAVFNALLLLVFHTTPIPAKVIAVAVATVFSWVANRLWTFRSRRTQTLGKEFVGFVIINIVGMLPAVVCLWVSHYLLGLTSALADNISANVIGLILGTIVRYACYRNIVFTGTDDKLANPVSPANTNNPTGGKYL